MVVSNTQIVWGRRLWNSTVIHRKTFAVPRIHGIVSSGHTNYFTSLENFWGCCENTKLFHLKWFAIYGIKDLDENNNHMASESMDNVNMWKPDATQSHNSHDATYLYYELKVYFRH